MREILIILFSPQIIFSIPFKKISVISCIKRMRFYATAQASMTKSQVTMLLPPPLLQLLLLMMLTNKIAMSSHRPAHFYRIYLTCLLRISIFLEQRKIYFKINRCQWSSMPFLVHHWRIIQCRRRKWLCHHHNH